MTDQEQGRAGGGAAPETLVEIDWLTAARRLWRMSGKHHLSLVASGVAFNAFLAFIPFLTSVILTYGLVAAPRQVAAHIEYLAQLLPRDAAGIVGSELRNMVHTATASTGFGLLATLGLSLYGALRGATGIIAGLNIIFEVEESRSLVKQMAIAIAITVGMMLLFLLASAGISIVNFLSAVLPDIGGAVDKLLKIGFWVASAGVASAVIATIYRIAPCRAVTWRWFTAGSLFATVVWLVATFAFGFFVRNFGNFDAVYGALGAVIVLLLWLYVSAYVLLLGAELNQLLARSRRSPR